MKDFIEGLGITQNKLAVSIGVPPRRIHEIVHDKRMMLIGNRQKASACHEPVRLAPQR